MLIEQEARHPLASVIQFLLNIATILSFGSAIFRTGIYLPGSEKVTWITGQLSKDPAIAAYITHFLAEEHSYFWTMGNCTDTHCDIYTMIAAYYGCTRSDVQQFITGDETSANLLVSHKTPWFFYDTVNDLVSSMLQYLGGRSGLYLNTEECIANNSIVDFKHRVKDMICSKIYMTKIPKYVNSSRFLTHQSASLQNNRQYKFGLKPVPPDIEFSLYSTYWRMRNVHVDIFFKSFYKSRSVVWHRKQVSGPNAIEVLQNIVDEGLSAYPNQIQMTSHLTKSISVYSYIPPGNSNFNYNYTFMGRISTEESSVFGKLSIVDGIVIGGPFKQISQFEVSFSSQNIKNISDDLLLRWMAQIYIYFSFVFYFYSICTVHNLGKMNKSSTCKVYIWLKNCAFGSLLANDAILNSLLVYNNWHFGYSSSLRWSHKVSAVSNSASADVYIPLTFQTAVNSLSETGRGSFIVLVIFQLSFLVARNFLPSPVKRRLEKAAKSRYNFKAQNIQDHNQGVCKIRKCKHQENAPLTFELRVKYRIYGLIVSLYTFLVIWGLDKDSPRSKNVNDSDNEWLFALDLTWGTKFQPVVITFFIVYLILFLFPTFFMLYEPLRYPFLFFEKYRVFSLTSLILETKRGLSVLSFPAVLEVHIRHHIFQQNGYLPLLDGSEQKKSQMNVKGVQLGPEKSNVILH